MSTTAPIPGAELTQAPFTAATRRRGGYSRRPYDILGIAWLHGAFHAAIFRRQTMKRWWKFPGVVRTVEEFEGALDEALVTLRFGGSEVSLILEHDEFVHQTEQAPAFADSASRAYLRARVERFEKEHQPVLWVSQRTVSARQEAAFLLHLLPSAFYGRINGLLLARRLDLTRILPIVVPLQQSLTWIDAAKDKPVLVAADMGEATALMVARGDGELLFSRTMLARWDVDPARVGVEVNRSVLYAKQQFGAAIDRVVLVGAAAETVLNEVKARCGAGKEVIAQADTPIDWLQAVAKLSPRHPVNLVAGYLGRKRRQQFIRRALIGGCWLTLALLGLDAWTHLQTFREERERLRLLQSNRVAMIADRERLHVRNSEVQRQREFIRQVIDDRLPAVPPKFLGYFSSVLPQDCRLTELSVKWDTALAKWSFHAEGQLEGDEETCRETLTSFQKNLAHGPLRARCNDVARTLTPAPAPGLDAATAHRFTLEGTLFEE